MSPLAKLLEAALFAASRPLTAEELATLEPGAGVAAVRAALDELPRLEELSVALRPPAPTEPE